MVFFFNSILAQVLLNGYYVFRLAKHKSIPKVLKVGMIIIIVLEMMIYFTGLIFRPQLDIEIYALIQKINVFWVMAGLYFLVILAVFDLLYYLNKKWVFHIQLKRGTLLALEIALLFLFGWFINTKLQMAKDNFVSPEIKEFEFEFTSTDTLTTSSSFYKVLVFADAHLGYIINQPVLKKYVDIVNAQHADIIVINGDLVDYYLEPLIQENIGEELRRLSAPYGVYFVPGNHEYKVDPEANFEWIRSCGMTLLKDSVVTVNDELHLIGWDDYDNRENRISLDKLLEQVPSKETSILFAHQPSDIDEAVKFKLPLTICGHTHGGQVFPANYGGLFKNYFYGMHEYEGSSFYITSGIGLSGFPLKIMAHSEIAIFNIEIK